jgi:hypothetical protein
LALLSVVIEAWPHKPYTFRALRKTFGAMWVRCDACRRYAPLSIGGLQEVDYRSKTFSCSQCGSEAYLAVIEPIKEAGMQDSVSTRSSGPSATPQPSTGSPVEGLVRRLTTRAVNCPAARLMAGARIRHAVKNCFCWATVLMSWYWFVASLIEAD